MRFRQSKKYKEKNLCLELQGMGCDFYSLSSSIMNTRLSAKFRFRYLYAKNAQRICV